MKLKYQICTLDQAQQIDKIFKEAGIKPPTSLWIWCHWIRFGKGYGEIIPNYTYKIMKLSHHHFIKSAYSAYTGDELSVLISAYVEIDATAHIKADIVIELLKKSQIELKEFKYPDKFLK